MESSLDFSVIGAYPGGRNWDLLRGVPGERPQADRNIATVPLPSIRTTFRKEWSHTAFWLGSHLKIQVIVRGFFAVEERGEEERGDRSDKRNRILILEDSRRHARDLGRGLLRSILRQAGVDMGLDEFLRA